MPFNALPAKDFVDRVDELDYIRLRLLRDAGIYIGNILLEGPRGIGKTELLKHLFRDAFWNAEGSVPFYYSFRRATLHAGHFARDYFTRFIRQYIAFVKKDPSLADNMSVPLTKLLGSSGVEWMADLIDDFRMLQEEGSLHELMLGAVSAPLTAAREGGRRVLIMLDDFPLATRLYEKERGDASELTSLFEVSINAAGCRHIFTGSPEGILERTFADNALRGKAERMFMGPLPEDDALSLFGAFCEKMGIEGEKEAAGEFIRILGGNPLYIRNMALALRKMNRKKFSEKDLWECYSIEVTEGETAFYWSSVFDEFLGDGRFRGTALKLLMRSMREEAGFDDRKRLSALLGVSEPLIDGAVQALRDAGLIAPAGRKVRRDAVLDDVVSGLYMKEIEGRTPEKAKGLMEKKYASARSASEHFEMVIPMASDAELVAAKAVEQIGRNINLAPDVINQIQTALIESCINAFEHSGSHDRKVFIKFSARPDRIEIAVESPGRFFDPESVREPRIEEKLRSGNRRGWGLSLMRKIMDEVRVERADNLTRVVLIKNIGPGEVVK